MTRASRTVAAPEGWGLEIVRVPTGTEVELDLRLESVLDGVLVSGAVRAPVDAECGRCLEPVTTAVDVEVQELFVYDPGMADDEAAALDGDLLDLEPVVRDAVMLGLPMNPVCAQDCAGLCPGCGERLAALDPEHSHETTDPRWASLASLRTSGATGENVVPRAQDDVVPRAQNDIVPRAQNETAQSEMES